MYLSFRFLFVCYSCKNNLCVYRCIHIYIYTYKNVCVDDMLTCVL